MKIFKILVLASAILILIMSPWLIRNRLVLGTWQSSSLFGVQLYWGHLETLERYLGVPQEIAHQKNLYRAQKLVGNNFENPRAVSVLASEAVNEIKNNLWAYTKVYIFNLGLFFITDGYKGVASYIIDIKPNFINLNDFMIKFRFKEAFSYVKNFSLPEIIIPILGRMSWIILTVLSFFGIFLSVKEMPNQRPILILFSVLIFYFAIVTGPVFSPDPRFRMPINGFLLTFAMVSIFHFLGINFKTSQR